MSKYDLNGKSALITGGAGLLGKQHALALAKIGAKVYIADLNVESAKSVAREINNLFDEELATGVYLDVTDIEIVRNLNEKIISSDDTVEILVNNAAIDPKVGSDGEFQRSNRFESLSMESWDLEVSVGLTGALLCCQVFGSEMAKRKNGVILNIASDLSVIAPDQKLYQLEGVAEEEQPVKPVTYSVIKHGLIGLTKYLASYWGEVGVRVNALSPGGVFNQQDENFVNKLSSRIPMGRMANVDEYQSSVQYLCTDASSYMTGQNIVIDGGRSII